MCNPLQFSAISVNFVTKGILSEPRYWYVPPEGQFVSEMSNQAFGEAVSVSRLATVSRPSRSGQPEGKGSVTSIAHHFVQIGYLYMPDSIHLLFLIHPASPMPQSPTLHSITKPLFTKNRHLGLPIRPVVCSILRGIETCDHRYIILVRSLFIRDHPIGI